MKVAVVTPYFREDISILAKCHSSVLEQGYNCRHIIVADGHKNSSLDTWDADHVTLPRSHHDIGSTPRLIGAIHAIGLGYDGIVFLDADNWLVKDHVEKMVALRAETGAVFTSSNRKLYTINEEYMGPCPNTDPELFIDTNCMVFWRDSFDLLMHWVMMPDYCHLIGDRVMLHHVKKSGRPRAHSNEATVCYRCTKSGLYEQLGWPTRPENIQPQPNYDASFRQWEESGLDPLR